MQKFFIFRISLSYDVLNVQTGLFRSKCSTTGGFQRQAYQINCVFTLWQYGLWSFQTGGTKLERFLHKNQHYCILRIGSMGTSEVFKNQSFKNQLFSPN